MTIKFIVRSSLTDFGPGGRNPAELDGLPQGAMGEPVNFIEFNHHYDDLEPVKGAAFTVTFEDGSTRQGQVDDQGFARLEGVPSGNATVQWKPDSRPWKAIRHQANPHHGQASDAQSALALMQRLLG